MDPLGSWCEWKFPSGTLPPFLSGAHVADWSTTGVSERPRECCNDLRPMEWIERVNIGLRGRGVWSARTSGHIPFCFPRFLASDYSICLSFRRMVRSYRRGHKDSQLLALEKEGVANRQSGRSFPQLSLTQWMPLDLLRPDASGVTHIAIRDWASGPPKDNTLSLMMRQAPQGPID